MFIDVLSVIANNWNTYKYFSTSGWLNSDIHIEYQSAMKRNDSLNQFPKNYAEWENQSHEFAYCIISLTWVLKRQTINSGKEITVSQGLEPSWHERGEGCCKRSRCLCGDGNFQDLYCCVCVSQTTHVTQVCRPTIHSNEYK